MQRYSNLLIIVPILLLDRWAKLLVQDGLPTGGALRVSSWLSIVHWQNKGGLFGLMSHHEAGRYVFLLLPLAVIAGLAYYLIRFRLPPWTRFSLTFVLSGALGNMYDRICYGSVVDFILVAYKAYYWPAFNVADMSITFGIGLWLYVQLFTGEGQKRRDAGG